MKRLLLAALVLAISAGTPIARAQTTPVAIDALPGAGAPTGTELIPAEQVGIAVAMTVNQIRSFTVSNLPAISLSINGSGGISGILGVPNGGTGAISLTGLLKGNGTSAFTPATFADVQALYSGCATGTYLGFGGICSTPTFSGVTSVSLSAPSSLFTVSGSPGTGAASLGLAFQTSIPASQFLGSPASSAGTPTMRSLLGLDIPAINLAVTGNGGTSGILPVTRGGTGASTLSGLLVGNGTGPLLSGTYSNVISLWSGCTSPTTMFPRADGTCQPVSAGGSINSVGLTAPSVFTVTGSPLTGAGGTLALAFATGQPANQVLASPNGTSGALGVRALVGPDIPAINLAAIGNSGVFGNLPVANLGSGTGASATTCWHGNATWGSCGSAISSANPSATVGPVAVNGTAATFLTSDSAPAINLTATYPWTGPHSFGSGLTVGSSLGLKASGEIDANSVSGTLGQVLTSQGSGNAAIWSSVSAPTTGANPTAQVGPTANNGSATTFMRSDASPVMCLTCSFTWLGTHLFDGSTSFNPLAGNPVRINGANGATGSGLGIVGSFTGAGSTNLLFLSDTNNTNGVNLELIGNGATTPAKTIRVENGQLQILNSAYSNSLFALSDNGNSALSSVGASQAVAVTAPSTFTSTVNIEANGNTSATAFLLQQDAGHNAYVRNADIGSLFLGTGSTNFWNINPAGTLANGTVPTSGEALNLASSTSAPGITVDAAPSGWTTHGAIDMGTTGAVESDAGTLNLVNNAYFSSPNWIYKTTGTASYVRQDSSGDILLQTAASGSTGANVSFLNRLEVFNDGGVVIGAPTGGDKGGGAINMQGCFVNNVACSTTTGTMTSITAGTGLTGGTITGSGTIGLSTPVSVANGGNGTSNPAIVAGTNISVSGTWPTQTVSTTTPLSIAAPASGAALTANGLSGNAISKFVSGSSATTASNDLEIDRAGSTAGAVGEGPNLALFDTTNTRESVFQMAGGQTEFWQYNSSWIRNGYFGTTNGLVIGAAGGGDKGAGTINAAGTIYQNNTPVCLSSGTNCPFAASLKVASGVMTTSSGTCTINQNTGSSIGNCISTGTGVAQITATGFSTGACTVSGSGSVIATVVGAMSGNTQVVNIHNFAGIAVDGQFSIVCIGQ